MTSKVGPRADRIKQYEQCIAPEIIDDKIFIRPYWNYRNENCNVCKSINNI